MSPLWRSHSKSFSTPPLWRSHSKSFSKTFRMAPPHALRPLPWLWVRLGLCRFRARERRCARSAQWRVGPRRSLCSKSRSPFALRSGSTAILSAPDQPTPAPNANDANAARGEEPASRPPGEGRSCPYTQPPHIKASCAADDERREGRAAAEERTEARRTTPHAHACIPSCDLSHHHDNIAATPLAASQSAPPPPPSSAGTSTVRSMAKPMPRPELAP